MKRPSDVSRSDWAAWRWQQARWYMRQLLPLSYHSWFKEDDGKTYFTTWRMWFGRVFAMTKVEIS